MAQDEPSFLTSPPASLPDPAAKPTIVLPPLPPPYRTPGMARPERPERPARAATPASIAPVGSEATPVPTFGDAAGEHLTMERGQYRAWAYVVVAFAFEAAILGFVPAEILKYTLGRIASDNLASVVGYGIGAVLAWRVFSDRWRCIEAHASRFCSGLVNLSILYVPLVALTYANIRGLARLTRNE